MTQTAPSSSHMQFAQCAIGSRQRVWFIAQEGDTFRLLQLRDGNWAVRTPEWPIATLCGVDRGANGFEVVAIGPDGELLLGTPGRFNEDRIPGSDKQTARYGIFRDARFIGDDLFAVGMSRQAYRRHDSVWSDIGSTIRGSGQLGVRLGFNAVAGKSPHDVYAVGFGGEIYQYDGVDWHGLDSPTSVALHGIVVLPSSDYVICGAAGVLLQGRGQALAPVKNSVTRDNLYGLAYFKGDVFVASQRRLFVIGRDGLKQVDIGLEGPLTFGSLASNDDVIYSVGVHHILASDDGRHWQQVTCPV